MAVYDLQEEEQISQLKAWWEQYGRLVTAVAVVAALASVGWQGWRWYQDRQAAAAGALYFVVQQAAEHGDAQKAREAAGQIIDKYSGTTYADLAALVSANVQFEHGEAKNARAELEWVADKGNDPALRELARLRLATVLFQQGELDAALARLATPPAAPLAARFDDLRGDILAAQGKPAEAKRAYQAALDTLAQGAGGDEALRHVVRVKLDALEG
jgi:predicted negative regulator of RcsB-dependent stress response